MFARNIMTKNVITVSPETPVTDVATLLVENRISAVPVVKEDGSILGIVSEGDLVHRVQGDHQEPRSWWLKLIADPEGNPKEYLRSHGRKAVDVMTTPVETTTEFASISEIASKLEAKRIKRLPVVDEQGRVVGIVSRANIIQILVGSTEAGPTATAATPADEEILKSLQNELKDYTWGNSSILNLQVENGIVRFWGMTESDDARKALELAAANTKGVKAVENNLGIGRLPAAAI